MYHIVYQSSAVGNLSVQELKQLLRQSRLNNLKADVTGLLLYCDGNFLQVLEGAETTLHNLYGKIKADSRHTHVSTLSEGLIEQRIFSDWTMGFQFLSGEDFARLMGYINPFRTSFLDACLPKVDESVLGLLKSFVRPGFPRF